MRSTPLAGAALVLATLAGCARPPYPVPQPRRVPATQPPGSVETDPGDEARIRELEAQCRLKLSGARTGAALAAIDDVRQAVGAACELATVDEDPLRWRLQCSADGLFAHEGHELIAAAATCPAARGKLAPWACAGAVLGRLLGDDGAAFDAVDLVVAGHTDLQPLASVGAAHVCTALQARLGFEAPESWQPLQEDATNEARVYANRQLAWCRAAAVADALRTGMGAAADRAELAVLGMGASWASTPGTCGQAGSATRADCPGARRIDVLVRMHSRAADETSTCVAPGLNGALACLQDCVERVALGSAHAARAAEVPITNEPLFVDGRGDAATLPAGWYLHRMPADAARRLALDRVCALLGVDAPHCGR